MKKERDYHRMNHNRVAQEKNKLINDLKRLKTHYESYEPLLRTMKAKYDTAIREKVINQLERDRAITEIASIKKNENDKGIVYWKNLISEETREIFLFSI